MAVSNAQRSALAQRFAIPFFACLLALLAAFLPDFRLCSQPAASALAERSQPETGFAELRLPCHALQRQGLVRLSGAWQEAGRQPGLLPLAVLGEGVLPMPPQDALAEAKERLAGLPAFPAQALLDLLRDVPAVRLAGTPDRGRALLVAFTRRDCPACRTLGALLDGLAPQLDFPVGMVPAGSASQARTFYRGQAGSRDGSAVSAGLAELDALAERQPARVRDFAARFSQAPRLPLLCWAAGGSARLASLKFRDIQTLLWLLKHDPACFDEKKTKNDQLNNISLNRSS